MEVKGKIICKKSDNKAFKLGNDWYNVNDIVIPYLEKLNKGDEVVVIFEKKGVARYVSKLMPIKDAIKEETSTEESTTGFACEVCGKELKDDKFKVCYMCNKKGLKSKTEEKKNTNFESTTKYGSPEDIMGKELGCALNAAATVAGGCGFSDPDTAAQFVRELASNLVEWLRDNK